MGSRSVPKRKHTIYDVAARAGASPSTVSAALSGAWKARRIKPETAHRVIETARAMGYAPNMQARGLRSARSGLVGMILPEHDNRFFSSLSQTFAQETRKRGLCPVVVCTRRAPAEEADAVEHLLSYAIDALVVVGASDPDAVSRLAEARHVPHVFVDQPCRLAPSIISDNREGAHTLTTRILDAMGERAGADPRERLYFVGGDARLPASASRIAGFREAMAARGAALDEAQILACGYEAEAVRRTLSSLRARLGGLPAGLIVNSITGFEGALTVLGELDESELLGCALGCYDYDPFGVHLRFPVWMVRQRAGELMRIAFRTLDAGAAEPQLTLVAPVQVSPH